MYLRRTRNQFNRNTREAKSMKHVLATNSPINRACLHSIPDLTLGSPRGREFKELLLEAVDEGLSFLGDSAKRAVYFYLKRTFKIEKQEIANKIEGFTNAIEEIFGPGAKFLQIEIMKHLYEKVGRDFEYFPQKDELLFTEYVAAVGVSYIQAQAFRPHLTI